MQESPKIRAFCFRGAMNLPTYLRTAPVGFRGPLWVGCGCGAVEGSSWSTSQGVRLLRTLGGWDRFSPP